MEPGTRPFGLTGFGNRVPFGLLFVSFLLFPNLLWASDPFTIVAIPDTQIYARSVQATNDYFIPQMNWIKNNVATENIAFVTHLGDITDNATSFQYSNAITAMNVIDGVVPHGVVRGNHDIENSGLFLNNFGPNSSRFQGQPWYGGAAPSGFSNYQKINAGGRDFIMLGLDITATIAEVAWAQSVIDANPGVPTILSTHNYLAETGAAGRFGTGTGERGRIPHRDYGSDYSPEEIFQTLIYPNDEIFMVLAGHSFAQYNLVDKNILGNDVHEILVDYQTLPNGGNSFLRTMEFDLDNSVIHSSTYSPVLNRLMVAADTGAGSGMLDLNDPNGHTFDINIDFNARYGVVGVPEPSSLGLCLIGGSAMALRRRKSKWKNPLL